MKTEHNVPPASPAIERLGVQASGPQDAGQAERLRHEAWGRSPRGPQGNRADATGEPALAQPVSRRRGFLRTAAAAIVGVLAGRRAAQAADTRPAGGDGPFVAEGQVLRQHVRKGRPPVEPLDTMVRFERSDDSSGRPITHQVLSLVHEEKGKRSFPWTMYSHLTTHHVEGDACVHCARLTKSGPGWSSGLHAEVFGHDRGVGLGVNVEMYNHYAGPDESKMIGVNILCRGATNSAYGIQVHDGGEPEGCFETAIGLNGRGTTGLDLAGRYGVGINARNNTIRVNEGTRIELDGQGRIAIRYQNGRIEFLNGDKCVGHIDMNGEDHAL